MRQIFRNKEGATAIEYGLIAGLIAVAIIVFLITVVDDFSGLSSTIHEKLKSDAVKANEIASDK